MRRSQEVDQPLGFRVHDHVLWPHTGVGEWRSALDSFLREGVVDHQRLLYVAPQPEDELLADVEDSPELSDLLASGQLAVATVPADPGELGGAVTAGLRDELCRRVAAAVADGYSGLRLASAVTRTVTTEADAAAHLRFELCMDRMAATSELVVMCGIDRAALCPETIQGEYAVHPLRGKGPDAPWLHALGADTWVLRGQVDMVTKSGFEQALAALAHTMEGSELHLRVSQVEFVDVAGLRALVRLADQLASRGCLVLHDPPGWLSRMLSLAYGEVPGLEVRHSESQRGGVLR